MKKVNIVVVNGSPRAKGNSDLLCDEFIRGAKEAGNTVDKIALREKMYRPARPAMYALKLGNVFRRLMSLSPGMTVKRD